MYGNMGAGTALNSYMGDDGGDTMTVVLMRPYDPTDLSAVTIYSDPYCRGRSGRLFAPSDANSRAMYIESDLRYWNVSPNNASSVRVPYGLTLELYDEAAFGGAVKVVHGGMFADSVS